MGQSQGKNIVPGPGDVIALLGRGSSFEGKLTFEGTVRIDGAFSGEVFSEDTLVIGEGGVVHAEIEVGTLILQGSLFGNVRATDVVDLRAPGRLEGNITAPNIMMERGVYFDGNCVMGPAGGQSKSWQPTDSSQREPPPPSAPQPAQTVAPGTRPAGPRPSGAQPTDRS